MCGIVGIWNLDGRPVTERELTVFRDSLAHRGPDGASSFVDREAAIGLGHRRLAILDLSDNGAQPMPYEDGRFWITYNGEIYNFLELRKELQDHGHRFRTESDAEVILASYSQWGADCQFRFNGMWAFAIWDKREQKLFLSRDRFGVKPLYFTHAPNQFAFASETKAFLSLAGFTPENDADAMLSALTNNFHVESQEKSLLKNVKRLLPGHSATVTSRGITICRWWRTLEHVREVSENFSSQVEQFKVLFEDACKIRMRSDVPVVSCLSGGLDSSSIVSTIAGFFDKGETELGSRIRNDRQLVFVATFPGAPNDERRFAQIVVDKSKAKATFCEIQESAVTDNIDAALYSAEEIFFNIPSAIWLTYRSLREHGLYVTIDGHGGDELLAGYPQHINAAIYANRGLVHPIELKRLMTMNREVLGQQSQWPTSKAFSTAVNSTPVMASAYKWLSHVRKAAVANPVNGSANGWLRHKPAPDHSPFNEDTQSLDPFSAALYGDFHITVLPTLLRVFDRASMAHGVEIRMPFLDWRLVTFCFSLNVKAKLGDGFTKRLLREAMKGVLPEEIRTRKNKIGFASPMDRWFGGQLSGWIRDVIESQSFLQSEMWDGPAINKFVNDRTRTGTWSYHEAEKVWPFINAAVWLQQFRSNKATES